MGHRLQRELEHRGSHGGVSAAGLGVRQPCLPGEPPCPPVRVFRSRRLVRLGRGYWRGKAYLKKTNKQTTNHSIRLQSIRRRDPEGLNLIAQQPLGEIQSRRSCCSSGQSCCFHTARGSDVPGSLTPLALLGLVVTCSFLALPESRGGGGVELLKLTEVWKPSVTWCQIT